MYALRAAQSRTTKGTVPDTSYELQAELARNHLNDVNNDEDGVCGTSEHESTLPACHCPSRDVGHDGTVNPDVAAAATSDRPNAGADMTALRDALAEISL
jgi:hypothetical protein